MQISLCYDESGATRDTGERSAPPRESGLSVDIEISDGEIWERRSVLMDVYQLMDLMFSVNFQVLSLVVTLLIVYIENTKK